MVGGTFGIIEYDPPKCVEPLVCGAERIDDIYGGLVSGPESTGTYAEYLELHVNAMETIANVTAVVGGVLLAAGVAMIVFGGDDDEEERPEVVGVNAVPLEGGGMLQLTGRF